MVTRVPAEVYRVGVEALTWELSFVPTKKKKKKKKRGRGMNQTMHMRMRTRKTRVHALSCLPRLGSWGSLFDLWEDDIVFEYETERLDLSKFYADF